MRLFSRDRQPRLSSIAETLSYVEYLLLSHLCMPSFITLPSVNSIIFGYKIDLKYVCHYWGVRIIRGSVLV